MLKKLKDVCTIRKGTEILTRDMIEGGKYPVYSGGYEPTGYTDEYNHAGEVCTVIEKGNAGYVDYKYNPFYAGNHIYMVEPKDPDTLDPLYLYYYLKSKEEYIRGLAVIVGVHFLHPVILDNIHVDIIDIEEQRRTAQMIRAVHALCDNMDKIGGGTFYAGYLKRLIKYIFS